MRSNLSSWITSQLTFSFFCVVYMRMGKISEIGKKNVYEIKEFLGRFMFCLECISITPWISYISEWKIRRGIWEHKLFYMIHRANVHKSSKNVSFFLLLLFSSASYFILLTFKSSSFYLQLVEWDSFFSYI